VKKDSGRSAFVPKRKDAIVRQLSDEFLVYDDETNQAHCLNQTAAEVWRLCDGKKTVAEIVRAMEKQSKSTVDEQMVWMAVTKFAKAGLLRNRFGSSSKAKTLSRREVVRKVGAAAAAALAFPVVTSILVPTAAAAGSPCRHNLAPCPQGNSQCCSMICTPIVKTCLGG
jgi:hypothetical protein